MLRFLGQGASQQLWTKNVVVWDSQTVITETDRYTDEQGVDGVDEEDSADEQ